MAEQSADKEPTIVERWLGDQQQWQRTILTYLDSMAKNDEFLVHLGNAMRGSLLAGKPYPTAPAQNSSAPETPADDRLDQLHYAIHQLEGQVQDVRLTLEEIRRVLAGRSPAPKASRPEAARRNAAGRKKTAAQAAPPPRSRKRQSR